MGGHESVSKDNFESDQYFRERFREHKGMTKINMMLTVRMMMIEGYTQKEDPYVIDDLKGPDDELNDPHGHMRDLVRANRAYSIEYHTERVVKFYINDLDCLRMSNRLQKIAAGKERDYNIYLPISGLNVDLKTKQAFFDKHQSKIFKLVENPQNKKYRNWNSKKYTEAKMVFVPQPVITKGQTKSKDIMIGLLWSIEKKGSVNALPSMNEVFYGLYSYIANFIKDKAEAASGKKGSKNWIKQLQNCYKTIFDYILELTDFKADGDVPLKLQELKNPYSKATCLILYMYSMESPFAIELNNSWKSQDLTKIEYFGPIERCLYEILNGTEQYRHDRLDSSAKVQIPQCFLVFKGATLTTEQIQEWSNNVGRRAIIPGNTCFSHYLKQALISTKSTSTQYKPVLFVMNVFNELNYPGFRLSNEKYSPYPNENEILIPGGTVVEIEGQQKCEPRQMQLHRDQAQINGKQIQVFYLIRFG